MKRATVLEYDSGVPGPEAGCKALWFMYRWGLWGYLGDLGMERAVAEPALLVFDQSNVVIKKPTKTQCRLLEEVPGFADARRELQLAYILKYYSDEQEAKKSGKVLSRRSKVHPARRLRSTG